MTPEAAVEHRIIVERRAAARAALTGVIAEIDGMSGNEIYRRAWKKVSIRVGQMVSALETVNTSP